MPVFAGGDGAYFLTGAVVFAITLTFMLRRVYILWLVGGFFWAGAGGFFAFAEDLQRADLRPALGDVATPFLRYDSSAPFTNQQKRVVAVTNMAVAGSWDSWTGRYEMATAAELRASGFSVITGRWLRWWMATW